MSNTTIDQQFVEYVVKTIVGNPDAVSIERTIDEKGVLLELTVDAEDLGRVIGKRGSTAQSLRTLLRALGTKNDARYNLKIVDVGEGRERPERDESRNEAPKDARQEDTDSNEPEAEEPAQKDEVVEEKREETEAESSFEKTRRELADLDDLDI